ncbi:hypothetical protein KIH39_23790 [Telmatocola sphagniphila]|uniref:Uncharacterized protein n=1 Tax=Telmatocola sphagniphila TaxID=1123043 RepID=A0A8E6EXN7_9BACT|nr:hypothetical protein [Telmatocola sphagniphila]QVL31823.1 hypothetical protein KIH39_23790 [Telmatocola sphagniphila]
MRRPTAGLRLLTAIGFASLLIMLGTTAAQQATTVPNPPFIGFKDNGILSELRNGKIKPGPETKAACQVLAKSYAYKLAHFPADGSAVGPDGKQRTQNSETASSIIDAFRNSHYPLPSTGLIKLEQAIYLAEVSKAMDVELKFVLEKDPRPLVQLNAVRFMAEIAKGPNPAQIKTLLGIVNEKLYSNAFKNYAFQGIRNLLAQKDPEDTDREKPLIGARPNTLAKPEDIATLTQVTQALENVILNKSKNQWTNESLDVVQYIRRNAIEALGAVPVTGIYVREEAKARPALTLFRVMIADPLVQPPPSLKERVEAMFGLCSQQIDPQINLDVLAYGVNQTLLDLITAQGEQSANKASLMPSIHWKMLGGRLIQAADGWKINGRVGKYIKNDRKPEYLRDLADRMKAIGELMEVSGVDARVEVGPLTDWAANRKPVTLRNQLYKDDPSTIFSFTK